MRGILTMGLRFMVGCGRAARVALLALIVLAVPTLTLTCFGKDLTAAWRSGDRSDAVALAEGVPSMNLLTFGAPTENFMRHQAAQQAKARWLEEERRLAQDILLLKDLRFTATAADPSLRDRIRRFLQRTLLPILRRIRVSGNFDISLSLHLCLSE